LTNSKLHIPQNKPITPHLFGAVNVQVDKKFKIEAKKGGFAMLKIKFKKVYIYEPELGKKYCCRLYVYLPACNNCLLKKELLSETQLLGSVLHENWGTFIDENGEYWRRKHIVLFAKHGWQDLQQQVNDEIKHIINQLKEIVNFNKEQEQKKPSDESLIVEI